MVSGIKLNSDMLSLLVMCWVTHDELTFHVDALSMSMNAQS
jgi:hypothetical protein